MTSTLLSSWTRTGVSTSPQRRTRRALMRSRCGAQTWRGRSVSSVSTAIGSFSLQLLLPTIRGLHMQTLSTKLKNCVLSTVLVLFASATYLVLAVMGLLIAGAVATVSIVFMVLGHKKGLTRTSITPSQRFSSSREWKRATRRSFLG